MAETAIGLALTLWYHLHLGRSTMLQINVFCRVAEINYSSSTEEESPIPWLNDVKWKAVKELERLKEFKNLSKHIKESSEEWLHWSSSEYVETSSLPKPYDKKIVGFLKLLLVSTIRPDSTIEAAKMFYLKLLKSNHSATAESLQTTVHSIQPLEPLALISPSINPKIFLSNVQRSCYPLVELDTDSLLILTLTDNMEQYLEEIFTSAAEKGQWIVLRCLHCSEEHFRMLGNILGRANESEVHKRFRIWLIIKNKCIPSSRDLAHVHKVDITFPKTIRESVERCFKILGDSVLSLYSYDDAKYQLISVILLHIALETRQSIESGHSLLNISDDQWRKSELMLRQIIQEQQEPDPSSVELILQSQILSVYLPNFGTKTAQDVIKSIVIRRLNSSAILGVSEHIPVLTHYTIPSNNLLDDHMTQLEFIYKASNDTMSFLSPALITEKKIQENLQLRRSIKVLFSNEDSGSYDVNFWTKRFLQLISKLKVSFPSGRFFVILKFELDILCSWIQDILIVLEKNQIGYRNLSSRFSDFSLQGGEHLSEFDVSNFIEYKTMNQVLAKGEYLLSLAPYSSIPNHLNLQYFEHPETTLLALVNEFSSDEFEDISSVTNFLYVPHSIRTLSGFSSQCLHLDGLMLVGGTWDSVGERILPKEKAFLENTFQEISLPIIVKGSKVAERVLASSEVSRVDIPVYGSFNSATPPIFEISLPSSMPEEDCLLQAIRITLKL